MRRRRDLTGWILMAVLFIGAMALIFYILLMRAQHLASMEDRRDEPQSRIERVASSVQPAVVLHADALGYLIPHQLEFEPLVA